MALGWRIAAGEYRFGVGALRAAHQMLVVLDPDGRPVRQVHGLASWWDPRGRRWRCKPIGYLPGDRLRVYDTARGEGVFLPVAGVGRDGQGASSALAAGYLRQIGPPLSGGEVEDALAPALRMLAAINALSPGPEGGGGLPYPFMGLGRNSNSVFRTLTAAFGLGPVEFPDRTVFRPGARDLLIPPGRVLHPPPG